MTPTPKPSARGRTAATTPRSRGLMAAWLKSIAALLLLSTVAMTCRPQVIIIPADKAIGYLAPGQSYQATNGIYLVPPARMQDFLRALPPEK